MLCIQVFLFVRLLYTVHMFCLLMFLSIHLLYTIHMLCLQVFLSIHLLYIFLVLCLQVFLSVHLLYIFLILCLQVFLSVYLLPQELCTLRALSTYCALRCFCQYTAVHCPHAVPSGVSVSTQLYTVHMLCLQVFLSVHLLYTVHMLCLQAFMSVHCCTVYTCCVFRCFCLCTCCTLHCPHAVFSGVSVRSPGGPAERRAAGGRCVRRAHGAVGEERAVCRRPHATLVLPHHDRRLARRQSPRQLQGKAEFRAVGNRPIDHVVGFSPPPPTPIHTIPSVV